MIQKYLTPFLFYFFLINLVNAQGIRGKISNEQGEPVPYANIYVPILSVGTTSNIDGNYELKLPTGNWKVLIQYLGYQSQTFEIAIDQDFKEIPIILIVQDYRIPEIKILASGEDPAYYIMRRAIAMAPYYLNQVSKYNCNVYVKVSGELEKIPAILKLKLYEEEITKHDPFVLETLIKIEFELPNTMKEQVLAMRSSGKQVNTTPIRMISNNFLYYNNFRYISPVGVNALKIYRFKLESVFEDQGRIINKIKVIPKSEGQDVFSGTIYIADTFWNIHSADLSMEMPLGKINFRQLYAEVNKNTWMPVSYNINVNWHGFGTNLNYLYVATISDYQTTLNPALDHSFIEKQQQLTEEEHEIFKQTSKPEETAQTQTGLKKSRKDEIEALIAKPALTNSETLKLNRMIDEEMNRNRPSESLETKSAFLVSQKQVNYNSDYWEKLRPIPLTETEKTSFALKDSFLMVSSKPVYKDSILRIKQKFELSHLFIGKTYDYSIDSIKQYEKLNIQGLLSSKAIGFNTVDGFRYKLTVAYTKSDSTGKFVRIQPVLVYNFARQKLDATINYSNRLEGIHHTSFGFKAGSSTFDFNQLNGLGEATNMLYTLLFERNYKHYYRRDFLEVNGSRELINGLNLNIQLGYSNNIQLSNNSNFKIINYDTRAYLPNVPVNNTLEAWQLADHRSLFAIVTLEYTPRQHYRIQDHVKYSEGSKFPTFTLGYNGAFSSVFNTDSRYDLLKFSITQTIDFGLKNHFSYLINTGVFLNNQNVYFEDFSHFNTQATDFMFASYENSFRLLPFYEYSTSQHYIDVHASLEKRRLILKHLPLIGNTSVSEKLFVNYLSTPVLKNYTEVGYGVSKIMRVINAEVVAGFDNFKFNSAGVKVSLKLQQ